MDKLKAFKIVPLLESNKIQENRNRELAILKQHSETHNIHKSFSKMLVLAQIFGFLPAQGILGRDYRSLHFTWKSARVFYSVVTIFGACLVIVFQAHEIFSDGMDLMEATKMFFSCAGAISGCLFLRLAQKWPRFIKDWTQTEQAMASYGWPKGLNRKLNVLLVFFMLMALVEYLLLKVGRLVLAMECPRGTADVLTYFLNNISNSHIFYLMEYNVVAGVALQVVHLQETFIWSFIDVFVMIISTALAYRFAQITARIQAVADAKIDTEIIWKHLREDYNRLCKLCRRIDDEISYVVLITFASDLFFILVQLFNSLRQMSNNLERIYFYWSFGLLILRTICLCLFGAKVNDESIKPILILNSVSSTVYNLEIQRFIQQIGTSEVAITGRNFFSITRGLILSIAGAIVTYELVLIQFNDSLLKNVSTGNGPCPGYS